MSRTESRIRQHGAAVLLLVVTLLLGAAAVFYGLTTATPPEIERDRKTAEALAMAKAALITFAVSVDINATRLGQLPCPDINDDGSADTPCGNQAGTTGQTNRLGRLPWKTLGLPDLRDGNGEKLWYAVSNNFKNSTATSCTASGQAGCINSDTLGTITIRNTAGNIVNDATSTSPATGGVIAVIFSPGAALEGQNRSCAGGAGCTGTVCIATTTPKCNPANYLDSNGSEDNANFTDSTTNGFVNGVVRDSSENILVNDKLMTITHSDLIPLLEKRVVKEILNCLNRYAAVNGGRYPWANSPTDYPGTADKANTFFGRIANTLSNTRSSGNPAMSDIWPGTCTHTVGTWWVNWRDHVFYSVADAYKPAVGTITGCATVGACLSVNPPTATADKKIVVIASGIRLSGQSRSSSADKQNAANYLEGNYTTPSFTRLSKSSTFDDTVVFYPP
jgi:hypothetical protein